VRCWDWEAPKGYWENTISLENTSKRNRVISFNEAMKVFYDMTLYNLNKHHQAMELLLSCIAATSVDPAFQEYRRVISFYADKLDTLW
jgi:hypothetical protein